MTFEIKHKATDGFIRLALAAPFLRFLRRRGHDPVPTLARLGLSEDAVEDMSIFVHAETMYRLIDGWAVDAKEPYLGVGVAETFDIWAWKPVASAISDRKTLGAMLAKYVMNVPKETSAVSHSLHVDASGAQYVATRVIATSAPQAQNTGFSSALYIRLLKATAGRAWDPKQVCVCGRDLSGVPPGYEGVELRRSETDTFRLHFPADWLFHELPAPQRKAPEAKTDRAPEASVQAALEAVLSPRLDEGRLDPLEIAKLLGMSPSQLKRALASQNTTLPKEIKRLRVARAKELLLQDGQTITEVGAAVGYIDKSHFTRFFKSQTGITPTAFRAQAGIQ